MATRDQLRAMYPIFEQSDWCFFENAGGSQVPRCVIEAQRDYMLTKYVQLGAGYPLSDQATAVVNRAHTFLEIYMNAKDKGKVIMGASTSSLLAALGLAYGRALNSDDEVVVSFAGHEANVGPWVLCSELSGAKLKGWNATTKETCPLHILKTLLSPKTKILAFPHVSNLLGEIVDVKAISRLARSVAPDIRIVVDGVAYAPHRAVDVQELEVDYYAFSLYKVFCGHMACMYASSDAIKQVKGPNHFFVPADDITYKWELGGVNHEGCASVLALQSYFCTAAGEPAPEDGQLMSRATLARAFANLAELEQPLQKRIILALTEHPAITLYGPESSDNTKRVPTISFTHNKLTPEAVVAKFHAAKVACRNGHMYSARLLEPLGLSSQGVVRISLVHYNTMEEVERFCEVLGTLPRQ
eukprot:m.64721 g.64721  ORF g.64721 m.64721 type:complete len:414 (-) comp19572_c0_seq1:81-1322(-)